MEQKNKTNELRLENNVSLLNSLSNENRFKRFFNSGLIVWFIIIISIIAITFFMVDSIKISDSNYYNSTKEDIYNLFHEEGTSGYIIILSLLISITLFIGSIIFLIRVLTKKGDYSYEDYEYEEEDGDYEEY